MKYTIQQLSKMTGVSSRTLRYYDEINLLKPCEVNTSGYRVYDEKEVNLLQIILFYRELQMPLDKIKDILDSSDFSCKKALCDHREMILKQQKKLEILLDNVERSIDAMKRGINMKDDAKFEVFKLKCINENEEKYADEIREKYGEDSIKESYNKFSSLSKEEYDEAERLNDEIIDSLKKALINNKPSDEEGKRIAKMHKSWLSNYGNYSDEAHIGLAKMYLCDERFSEFYDSKAGKGACEFLSKAIEEYYK